MRKSYLFLGVVVILVSLFTLRVAYSFFSDQSTSTNNTFAAASIFPTPSPTPCPSASPTSGNIVINEINWGGANGDGNDEWIELLNTTCNPIDLAGWVVENLGTGSGPGANITIPSGTISANGFFLISNNDKNNSKINVDSDLVDTSVSLVDGGEQLTLKTSASGTVIDTANGSGAWFAGSNSTPKKSMERKSPPGDGTVSTNWQTATTHTTMDSGGPTDEFGTPKAVNGT